MTNILMFIVGVAVSYLVLFNNQKQVHELWQTAYQTGYDDGQSVGKAQFKLTDEQLRLECEYLHWETLDGRKR